MAYIIPRDGQGLPVTDRIVRSADDAAIPFDPFNADYVEYLRWLAAGNTAATAPLVATHTNTAFPVSPDPSRGGKLLSTESTPFVFYGGAVAGDDYLLLHSQMSAAASYAMPSDATAVLLSLYVGTTGGAARTISLYRDAAEVTNIASVPAAPATSQRISATLDADLSRGQILRLRVRGAVTAPPMTDVVATVYVKWRIT